MFVRELFIRTVTLMSHARIVVVFSGVTTVGVTWSGIPFRRHFDLPKTNIIRRFNTKVSYVG